MTSNGTNKSYQACSIILLKIDFESIINLGGENTHLGLYPFRYGRCCYYWWSEPAQPPPIRRRLRLRRAPLPPLARSDSLSLLLRGLPSRWLRLERVAGSPPASIVRCHGHHRPDPSLLAPLLFLSLFTRAMAVAWPHPWRRRGPSPAGQRPPPSLSLSVSPMCEVSGLGSPPLLACAREEKGAWPPFVNFFFVFFWLNNIIQLKPLVQTRSLILNPIVNTTFYRLFVPKYVKVLF